MVYVLNIHGQPLVPTDRHGRVKHLLRRGEAKVVRSKPFTIQLLYETPDHIQQVASASTADTSASGPARRPTARN